jgi:hypothetical protein
MSKHGLGRYYTNTALGYGRLTLLLVDAKNGGLPIELLLPEDLNSTSRTLVGLENSYLHL